MPESKQSALALLFSVRELNKETAQMELRHFVETCQTVTPFLDSFVDLLHPFFALEGNRRVKKYDILSSDANTRVRTSASKYVVVFFF